MRVERVDAALRVAADVDEAGFAQEFEVLRDGGRGHVEAARDVAGGELARGQHLEDPAAGRVGERGKTDHPYIISYWLN